jgi:Putative sensor
MVSTTPAMSRTPWLHALLRAPFSADTWRRSLYILLALPVGLVSVPLALVGGPAGRLQRRLARRLLRLEVAEPVRTGPRALVHAVLAAPLNFVALMVTAYGWSLVPLNLAYPLRPLVGLGAGGPNDWGGPTMAGAWAFHALGGGLVFLLLMPWIVRGVTWLQGRLVRALLG